MENLIYVFEILFLLLAILFSCLVFANAIEHLGEELNLGNQVTGSILAAVGTALPETIIPLVAIFIAAKGGDGTGIHANAAHDIAVGAIIGAPFMLSTLALFVLGVTIFIFREKRKTTNLTVDYHHLKRDLYYFLSSFILLVIGAFVSTQIKIFIAIFLAIKYAFYVFHTIKAGQTEEQDELDLPTLYLTKLKLPSNLTTIIIQTVLGLYGIIFFAEHFVSALEEISVFWHISPLVLSLIVTPIATELPEKVNSAVWASQKKDTLAVGNITGAMVFQTTIPGSIGLLLTPWKFDFLAYSCAAIAIISVAVMLIEIKFLKKLSAKTLVFGGLLYAIYIYIAFFRV